MKVISIIPARMGSSRFPGKPLAKINGIPMIEHVYQKVKKNKIVSEVIVATCDKAILNFIHSIGGKAIMTSKKHKRASDRCYEALIYLEKKNKVKYDIVVMVQGDEPMVHPNMINDAVKPMIKNKKINVVNLISDITNNSDYKNPNFIKVVHDKNLNALYFSRSPIPNTKFSKKIKIKKQVCIIPFRRNFLVKYNKMKPTTLEILESVDMLRILENGYKVNLFKTKYFSHAVDTKLDLRKVEKYLK
jgi:3-deoxy-manno-octulosonate cytidylyltransferase (CMP-KDO synthetase)|tara:strand:- start:111 stop:848 length:738 start_codon:yes stop_codon:yes gene_type:complete